MLCVFHEKHWNITELLLRLITFLYCLLPHQLEYVYTIQDQINLKAMPQLEGKSFVRMYTNYCKIKLNASESSGLEDQDTNPTHTRHPVSPQLAAPSLSLKAHYPESPIVCQVLPGTLSSRTGKFPAQKWKSSVLTSWACLPYLPLREGHRRNVGIFHFIQGANNFLQSLPIKFFIDDPHLQGKKWSLRALTLPRFLFLQWGRNWKQRELTFDRKPESEGWVDWISEQRTQETMLVVTSAAAWWTNEGPRGKGATVGSWFCRGSRPRTAGCSVVLGFPPLTVLQREALRRALNESSLLSSLN